jgi:hypothetical protein
MAAMTQYTGDTSIITNIGTTPQERGLTTDEFKAKFDEALKAFVEWFNSTHKTEFEAIAFPATGMKTDANQTMTAKIIAQNNTDYTTAQIRNITLSTSDASGGGNGDVWIKYTP